VIRELCDRVVVFYAGEVVESGTVEEIIEHPAHPYTQALLRVASVGDFRHRELQVIGGQPPQVGEYVTGCQFASRCLAAIDACRTGALPLHETGAGHLVRCARVNDESLAAEIEAKTAKAAADLAAEVEAEVGGELATR
jgi:oligopeptide/dipeptide ABC transporter ATP-binding protein